MEIFGFASGLIIAEVCTNIYHITALLKLKNVRRCMMRIKIQNLNIM
jgi:hypothetical protein